MRTAIAGGAGPPLRIWFKTLTLLVIIAAIAAAFEARPHQLAPRIDHMRQVLANFERRPNKPLVVALGTSLWRHATPQVKHTEDYDWIRLWLPGSTLDDFQSVMQPVLKMQPDLLVIGMTEFRRKSYLLRFRRALRQLPKFSLSLLSGGLIAQASPSALCSSPPRTPRKAAIELDERFADTSNELGSSQILKLVQEKQLPFVVVRMPVQAEVEQTAAARARWVDLLYSDAERQGITLLETGWLLDSSYFCADNYHLNRAGAARIGAWLEPLLVAALLDRST